MKRLLEALTREGEIVLGLVLMRNTVLSDKASAAPALVLGSFDFSVAGFEELYAVAERIETLRNDPDPSSRRAVEEIYEDEEYRMFRRRALPSCVAAPSHVMLFDELMRGDDFFELEFGEVTVPSPFVVMFANRSSPAGGLLVSAVVPRPVAEPVLQYLVEERARPEPSDVPPPLPRRSVDPAQGTIPPPFPPRPPAAEHISVPPPLPHRSAVPPPPTRKIPLSLRVGTVISFLVIGFLGFRFIESAVSLKNNPVPREPGAEALSEAVRLITGSRNGIAHGNTPEAKILAEQLSRQMKVARDTMFEHSSRESVTSEMLTKGQFLVFCQLNPDSCVFLIHVPELHRFTSSAKESMAELAYLTAAQILDSAQKNEVQTLAVATRGTLLYDHVLIGEYAPGSEDPLASAEKAPDKGVLAPSLKKFFVSKDKPFAEATP